MPLVKSPQKPIGAVAPPKLRILGEFRQFVAPRGHLTQQQMADEWPEPVSNRTIGKALKAIELTRKKTYGDRERDVKKRQAFLQQLAGYTLHQIADLDEAGVNDTEDSPCGDCLASERLHTLKLGHRTERVSMIAAWCERQVLAPMTFKGYGNTELFEAWEETPGCCQRSPMSSLEDGFEY